MLLSLILTLITFYKWIVILYCVFSFLYAFGTLDGRSPIVFQIGRFLARMTEPVLTPIRNILPRFGNVDISPIVLLLLIQYVVVPLVVRLYIWLVIGPRVSF
ncbi:hypothetical protein AA103196_2370 [Ameyamaea chiangmaiensis NBRC 103196]|uniref:YggT family protein n=1 Tax=Ameyamaea chiangmaiensis TaxID=442969 RepID=UPI002156B261|nr:YggT family protein [Ameyamaea chiangmaiensis]GBQ69993.1 hypothetical protein AA103196_2370 [Ameyamaea chiangmaiensis NBRC 103196]